MNIIKPMMNVKRLAKKIKNSRRTGNNEDYNNLEEVIRKNEDLVERICANVAGYIIISNPLKLALHSTFDPTITNALCKNLVKTFIPLAASSIRHIDAFDRMTNMRIKTRNCEFLVGLEDEFIVLVIQD